MESQPLEAHEMHKHDDGSSKLKIKSLARTDFLLSCDKEDDVSDS